MADETAIIRVEMIPNASNPSPVKTTPKSKFLTLKEKVEVIKEYEMKEENGSKLPQRKLALKYGCGKSQIQNIIAKKDLILEEWKRYGGSPYRKRLKTRVKYEEVNQETWEYFKQALAEGIPITGRTLKLKAKTVAETLGQDDFKASNGWLESFCKRNYISLRATTYDPVEESDAVVTPTLEASSDDEDAHTRSSLQPFVALSPEPAEQMSSDQQVNEIPMPSSVTMSTGVVTMTTQTQYNNSHTLSTPHNEASVSLRKIPSASEVIDHLSSSKLFCLSLHSSTPGRDELLGCLTKAQYIVDKMITDGQPNQ